LVAVSGSNVDGRYARLQSGGTLVLAGLAGDKVELRVGDGGEVIADKVRLEGSGSGGIVLTGGKNPGTLVTGEIEITPEAHGSSGLVFDGGQLFLNKSGNVFTGFKAGDVRFDAGGGTIYTARKNNLIDFELQGTGGLTKTGYGTLELTAANTYSGTTRIMGGTLLANNTTGSATGSGDIVLVYGGTLGGNGFVSGNVLNGGTVAPGNSPGTLHIGGNFQQNGLGTLAMEIDSTGARDLLLVDGTASLAGVLRVSSDEPLEFGERHMLLKAKEGISGIFSSVYFGENVGARARFTTTGNNLTMLVAPETYSQLATNANERALAGVLDTWITSDNGDTRTVAENLDLLSADEYRGVFNVLSPSLFAAGLATSIEQSQGQMMALNQHLNSRRLRPAVPNDAENPWEAWAISTGAYSPGSMSSLAGEDYSAGNFIAGIERRVVPGVTAGLFNSYGDSEGDFAGSSEIEEERFTLGAHATAQYGGSYANTALGFGILEMDVKRSIAFGNLSRKARSSTDGTEFFAMLSGGHDFRQGNWIFGPSAGLQYSKVRYDDVKENGAGALDLVVSNPEDDSLRSQIGGRVAYLHKANERLTLIPEARVFWQHDFLRDNETLDAAMEQGLGLGFQHQVADSDGDSVFTGIGLGFQTDFGFYGNVSYDLEFGREGDVNQTLSVGADWKF
ncbi:MAG: autotransporter domain-containing protein, partial [Verrucomicrobiaceae bacterium]